MEDNRSGESARSSRSGRPQRSSKSAKKKKIDKVKSQMNTQETGVVISDDETNTTVLSSDNESVSGRSSQKGRGRPATTGKGVLIREIRAQRDTLNKLKKETAEAEKIAQGQHDPAEYRKAADYKKIGDQEQEIKALPTRDIAAQLMETAKQIHGVAIKSSNLKGTLKGTLKNAAMMVQVGVDAISGRLSPREGAAQRELNELREEFKRVRMERDTLQKMVIPARDIPPQGTGHNAPALTDDGYTVTEMEEEEDEVDKTSSKFVRPTSSFLEEEKKKWPAIRPAIQEKRKLLKDLPREKKPATSVRTVPTTKENTRKVRELHLLSRTWKLDSISFWSR